MDIPVALKLIGETPSDLEVHSTNLTVESFEYGVSELVFYLTHPDLGKEEVLYVLPADGGYGSSSLRLVSNEEEGVNLYEAKKIQDSHKGNSPMDPMVLGFQEIKKVCQKYEAKYIASRVLATFNRDIHDVRLNFLFLPTIVGIHTVKGKVFMTKVTVTPNLWRALSGNFEEITGYFLQVYEVLSDTFTLSDESAYITVTQLDGFYEKASSSYPDATSFYEAAIRSQVHGVRAILGLWVKTKARNMFGPILRK